MLLRLVWLRLVISVSGMVWVMLVLMMLCVFRCG